MGLIATIRSFGRFLFQPNVEEYKLYRFDGEESHDVYVTKKDRVNIYFRYPNSLMEHKLPKRSFAACYRKVS